MANTNNPHGIKVGDAVYHVSKRKTIMGVEWMDDDESECECSWLDEAGHKQMEAFTPSVLRKVTDDTGHSPIFIG